MADACAIPAGGRQKTPHAVVAFDTTSDAMAMDAAARKHNLPGRVIPVPSEVNAGCGMAWSVLCCQRDELEAAMNELGLSYEGIYIVDLY